MRFLAITLALLLLPSAASAAFDDVSLTTDTDILVNGITIDVAGSTASVESLSVGATSFSFVLGNGSSIMVRSSERKNLSHDAATRWVTESVCDDTESKVGFFSNQTGNVTITVTPQSETCVPAQTFSGSAVVVIPPPPVPVDAEDDGVPGTPIESSRRALLLARIVLVLRPGTTSDGVSALQELLALDPTIYPEGLVTGYYGPLTRAAVERFQIRHGIVSGGTPEATGFGQAGLLTRAKLAEVFGEGVKTREEKIAELTARLAELRVQLEELLEAREQE